MFSCTFPLFLSFSILLSLEDVLYHEGKVRSHSVSICVCGGKDVGGGMGLCVCACAPVLSCNVICFTPFSLSWVSCFLCGPACRLFFFFLCSKMMWKTHAKLPQRDRNWLDRSRKRHNTMTKRCQTHRDKIPKRDTKCMGELDFLLCWKT